MPKSEPLDRAAIRKRAEAALGYHTRNDLLLASCRDVPALLDALEAAKAENARLRAVGGWRLLEHTKGSHDENRDPDCFPCAQAVHEKRFKELRAAGDAMAERGCKCTEPWCKDSAVVAAWREARKVE